MLKFVKKVLSWYVKVTIISTTKKFTASNLDFNEVYWIISTVFEAKPQNWSLNIIIKNAAINPNIIKAELVELVLRYSITKKTASSPNINSMLGEILSVSF